ncbi:lysophospholipid acyltransferase family protein [Sphingomicrobium nitratireducens]|uniref:lysophospholipid acyltransferase family protein n=1 Tax=Sphingomicrobium nitratireducens TaxID=2964666 RepID=UPI00223FB8C9|nr:lysophospholipid acyltransferase family protein [Sphingomicrobium nitratireducens]
MASRSSGRGSLPLALVRLVLLFALLAALLVPHVLVRIATGRSPVAHLFLAAAARIIGLRIRRIGPRPPVRSLLIANHPSWLDILAMGVATRCAFVSKAEVRDQWLLGWLADQQETLYVRREDRRAVAAQIAAVADRFDHHMPLAVFPEGTTSAPEGMRPFRPALLSAVTPPPPNSHLIPVAIDYGADRDFVLWTDGESGLDNARRILGRWRAARVAVRMLEPIDPGTDRKQLAERARAEIDAALKASPAAPPAL